MKIENSLRSKKGSYNKSHFDKIEERLQIVIIKNQSMANYIYKLSQAKTAPSEIQDNDDGYNIKPKSLGESTVYPYEYQDRREEFEVFIFYAFSVIESILCLINTLFDLKLVDKNVNLADVIAKLCKEGDKELGDYLDKMRKSKWYISLQKYRDAITHRVVVDIGKGAKGEFFICDNPDIFPSTFEEKRSLFKYVREIENEVDKLDKEIAELI